MIAASQGSSVVVISSQRITVLGPSSAEFEIK
jgi:hypothetical protein